MGNQQAFLSGFGVGFLVGGFILGFAVFATCSRVDCPAFAEKVANISQPKAVKPEQ